MQERHHTVCELLQLAARGREPHEKSFPSIDVLHLTWNLFLDEIPLVMEDSSPKERVRARAYERARTIAEEKFPDLSPLEVVDVLARCVVMSAQARADAQGHERRLIEAATRFFADIAKHVCP